MFMEVVCSLTPDDYREFQQAYFDRFAGWWERNLFKTFAAFGVAVMAGGWNWIFHLHRSRTYGALCTLCGLYLVWWALWVRFWKWRRWFRRNAHLYANLRYAISEDGVLSRTDVLETRAKWEHYRKYTETPNLFLLLDPAGSYLIVPKRAFSAADREVFRTLLKGKVKRCA